MVGNLEFQDHFAEGNPLPTRSHQLQFQILGGLDAKVTVKRNADEICVRTLKRLPKVPYLKHRPDKKTPRIIHKLVERLRSFIPALEPPVAARKKRSDIRDHYPDMAFHHPGIDPALDLDKTRIFRIIDITSNSKFKAVLEPVLRSPE